MEFARVTWIGAFLVYFAGIGVYILGIKNLGNHDTTGKALLICGIALIMLSANIMDRARLDVYFGMG